MLITHKIHWTDKFLPADESLLFSDTNLAVRYYNLMAAQSAAGVRLAPSGPPSGTARDTHETRRERFSEAPAAELFLDDAAERRIVNARRPTKRMVSFA